VSAGVGTPTLSMFGPTDPLQWAPLGSQHRFILGHGNSVENIPVEKVWHVLTDMLRNIRSVRSGAEADIDDAPGHSSRS
jgi:ADP-heptose:LPS heptosyltransferase